MTTTNTQQINWWLTAGTLRAAFTQDKRQDGTLYWCLTEQARQTVDDLTEWLHELHDDELPNDWRYNTIINVLFDLKQSNEPGGDCGVDTYTSDLIKWLTPSRMAYIDELQSEEIIRPNATMDERIRVAQYHTTEQIISVIRKFMGDNDDD